jgi:hypothetical protein
MATVIPTAMHMALMEMAPTVMDTFLEMPPDPTVLDTATPSAISLMSLAGARQTFLGLLIAASLGDRAPAGSRHAASRTQLNLFLGSASVT